MNRNIIGLPPRLLPILFCAMTPSLFAFNLCRHAIPGFGRRCLRKSLSFSMAPRLGVLSVQQNYYYCSRYFGLRAAAPPSSLFHSSQTDTETQTTSTSSAVRSIRPTDAMGNQQLLSFYRFVPISDPESIRDILFDRLKSIPGLRGTVYVAKEGINAQFAVPVGESLQDLLNAFGKMGETEGACLPFDTFELNPPNLGNVVNETVPTFDRLIVRTKDYILRDGINSSDTDDRAFDWSDSGMELDAKEWDTQLRPLASQSDENQIQLLDCRNTYESDQGTFYKSTPLNTQTFSETWSILDSQVESNTLDPSKPTYIFCTGGIRCVKVGAYLKQKLGFEDVRSLKHGIIGYERWQKDVMQSNDGDVENNSVDENNNSPLWTGENFLFDKRRFARESDGSSE